ncbi:MAG: hypothetical protein AAF358_11520 [Pseudomonadota bacterium]
MTPLKANRTTWVCFFGTGALAIAVLAVAHLYFDITFERKGFMTFLLAAVPVLLGSGAAYWLGGYELDNGTGAAKD